MSQCLIGPGVMQRSCHVNKTIKDNQNWTVKTEVASLEATHAELSHKNIFFSDFLVHRILHGMLRHAFAVFFLVLPLLPVMVKFALFMG